MILIWKLNTPSIKEVKNAKYVMNYHDADARLSQYCYNKSAFYTGFKEPEIWDHTLRSIRGLIYNDQRELIARGFPKSFNLGEKTAQRDAHPEWEAPYKVLLEKFNGYLCIQFVHNGVVRHASKGAMNHEYEQWAKEMWEKGLVHGTPPTPKPGTVNLYEAVAPADMMNHEIRYEPGLYYLGSIDIASDTFVLDTHDYPGEVHIVPRWEDAFNYQAKAKHEGYMAYVTTPDGTVLDSVKLKTVVYNELKQAKRELEKGINKGDLYRHFYLDHDDHVRFNWTAVGTLLGETADDWRGYVSQTIEEAESHLGVYLLLADTLVHSYKPTNNRKGMAMEILKKAPELMGLAMARWEGRKDMVTHVLNGRLLDTILAENEKVKTPET